MAAHLAMVDMKRKTAERDIDQYTELAKSIMTYEDVNKDGVVTFDEYFTSVNPDTARFVKAVIEEEAKFAGQTMTMPRIPEPMRS